MRVFRSIVTRFRGLLRGLRSLLIATGLTTMIFGTASAAPVFKLKPPGDYFDDPATLALLDAALTGDLARARLLVVAGADPNDEGPKSKPVNRLNLLHYAIAADSAEAIKVLVAVGADPERSLQGPGRPMLFAMNLKKLDLLSVLLDLKPIPTLTKDTLEYLVFGANDRPTLTLLWQRGAPIDFPDGAGYTIFMSAVSAEQYDLAEWILMQGASVTVETPAGMTPAYQLEHHLNKFRPGSPTHEKVLRLKALMLERGAVFPAPSPQEVREKRARGL